mmetsp:Transcript_26912/g.62006  ORF Transcript_26912/g.62006 Transcript_26912/m.62006 type:complete len:427 (-) Transcript_26912:94-1374(-)
MDSTAFGPTRSTCSSRHRSCCHNSPHRAHSYNRAEHVHLHTKCMKARNSSGLSCKASSSSSSSSSPRSSKPLTRHHNSITTTTSSSPSSRTNRSKPHFLKINTSSNRHRMLSSPNSSPGPPRSSHRLPHSLLSSNRGRKLARRPIPSTLLARGSRSRSRSTCQALHSHRRTRSHHLCHRRCRSNLLPQRVPPHPRHQAPLLHSRRALPLTRTWTCLTAEASGQPPVYSILMLSSILASPKLFPFSTKTRVDDAACCGNRIRVSDRGVGSLSAGARQCMSAIRNADGQVSRSLMHRTITALSSLSFRSTKLCLHPGPGLAHPPHPLLCILLGRQVIVGSLLNPHCGSNCGVPVSHNCCRYVGVRCSLSAVGAPTVAAPGQYTLLITTKSEREESGGRGDRDRQDTRTHARGEGSRSAHKQTWVQRQV